jgi:ABC-type multidrug transport system fused ATPase/permease subunit
MIRSIADGQTYFLGRRVGLRIRAILISLIYSKALKRMSNISPAFSTSSSDTNPGKITNLMSVDSTKILDVCCYLMYVWSTPLQAIIFISYLIYIAGLPALAGILCMIFVVPVAAYISSWLQKLRKSLMDATDIRIGAVNELLQAIRIVKFFA